ncbi:double-stranded RNA-binding protein 1-like isoform X2 [Phoenix dactylifera]|uniref:Double-stranded RNA-binding protein 1-like isoform X2 n=1 Tax=Phoenix dactylifera TaxID=42345 RepID=A0A8B9A4L5_PHODC|nr:double-stranded RNA-binding protein 1-like isoform X2 [Phoenix dactylifera]
MVVAEEQFMHKNRLQEYAQRSSIPLPIYQTINEGHPHAPQFRSTVLIDGVTFISSRTFLHRKEAEQDVAKLALEGISRKIKDEGISLIHADTTFCKSILYEYAVKMNIEKPTYTTSQLEGVLLPSFISSLVFDGKTYTGAAGRNKKEAEQIAARAVIQSILAHSDTRTVMSQIVKSKGKLYAVIQKNSDSGLSLLGNVASGQQARNDSSGSTVKGKEIQAAPANDDIVGVTNHKQLVLGQLPAAAETQPLLEAKKPKEEYPCEQSFGPIGGGTSPPDLAQGGLPSGLKSRVFESSDGSYHAEQNQVNDLAGPSIQSYDAQDGVPSSQSKRSRKKQKGGHQRKKARTEHNFSNTFPEEACFTAKNESRQHTKKSHRQLHLCSAVCVAK